MEAIGSRLDRYTRRRCVAALNFPTGAQDGRELREASRRRVARLTFYFPAPGSIRSNLDRAPEVGPRPRRLPARLVQEHARDGPGHQRLEAPARRQVPREREGEEGGRAHAAIRRRHRPDRARYAQAERGHFTLSHLERLICGGCLWKRW